MRIIKSYLNVFNKIIITVDDPSQFKSYNLSVKNHEIKLNIKKYSIVDNNIILTLYEDVNIKKNCYIIYENIKEKVWYYPLYSTKEFNDKFFHNCILGAIYNKYHTIFRLWSPPASEVKLILYKKVNDKKFTIIDKILMKESNGLWSTSIKGDMHNSYYNYEVRIYEELNEVVDPYAKAVSINGLVSVVLDLEKSNPKGWNNDILPQLDNYNDAIIYEASIRDLSSHPQSGTANNKKFLSLTEKNTISPSGLSTGINHIKELGITHLQLMPIFDFSFKSVDEENPDKYNWGYDPQNYNVPEGSYSTNAYDPICRIIELKTMIYHLHQNGIAVNMDVVYNHIYDGFNSNFQKIFPDYYFRFIDKDTPSNGSGCGNDIASEHLMVRKFIIDSTLYWAKEYHLDGFRFDLMGLIDVETMNMIKNKLKNINKSIMIYGEGWDLNTTLPQHLKSTYTNAPKLEDIAFFNDKIRDCLSGNIFDIKDKGFIMGNSLMEEDLKKCISSKYILVSQSINYSCCHDNRTLWDKITLSCSDENIENIKKMVKLSSFIILTTPGIPFIYSGEEFCRTKNGEDNSFNKADEINWIDWNRKDEFLDVFEHYKTLISIRKNHYIFRTSNMVDLKNSLNFIENTQKNTLSFIMKDVSNKDSWKYVLVAFNVNKTEKSIDIPCGKWTLDFDSNNIDKKGLIIENRLLLKPLSSYILYIKKG